MSNIFVLDNLPSTQPSAHIVLAHGSMAAADSPFLEQLAQTLVDHGLAVHRFEFAYMAARRTTGKKRPPPRAEKLMDEYHEAIAQIRTCNNLDSRKVIIGGKSLGGRVASMVATNSFENVEISGVTCLGYPFHPPKKPDNLRTSHLEQFPCPALILQGERDPFGTPDEVSGYNLDPRIQLRWIGDGDHDFAARKRSGFTQEDNIAAAAEAIAKFAA